MRRRAAATNGRVYHLQQQPVLQADPVPRPDIGAKLGAFVVLGCLVCGLIASSAHTLEHAGAALLQTLPGASVPASVRSMKYTVRSGDTVWSIASRYPQWETGAVEQWIADQNGGVTNIQPGQVIAVPSESK